MVAKDQDSNFQQLCKVPTDYGITFTKYKSSKTGLTVAIADIEGNWIKLHQVDRTITDMATCFDIYASSSRQRLFCTRNWE